MDYKIVSNQSPLELSKKVNELLNEGYELAGGVSIINTDNDVRSNNQGLYFLRPINFLYTQSLIKKQ
jgi:hypothetical protein